MLVFDLWSNFSDLPEYAIQAFSAVDPWVYPLVFVGIIGFLYTSMNSIMVAVVGILFTLGLFGTSTTIFNDVPEVTMLLYVISIIGVSLLIVTFIVKRRN